jgi:hypothetical protein
MWLDECKLRACMGADQVMRFARVDFHSDERVLDQDPRRPSIQPFALPHFPKRRSTSLGPVAQVGAKERANNIWLKALPL